MNLQETLTRKVGPLPVWGWGAVGLVGSFGLVRWLKRAKAGSPASTADNSGAYDSGYANGVAAGGSGGGFGSGSLPLSGGSLFQDQPVIQDSQSQTQAPPTPAKSASSTPLLVSKPTGDPLHDQAIQNPYVSSYLQSVYLAQQPKMSSPTGDVAHDTAIKDPAVSSYLQSLWLARN